MPEDPMTERRRPSGTDGVIDGEARVVRVTTYPDPTITIPGKIVQVRQGKHKISPENQPGERELGDFALGLIKDNEDMLQVRETGDPSMPESSVVFIEQSDGSKRVVLSRSKKIPSGELPKEVMAGNRSLREPHIRYDVRLESSGREPDRNIAVRVYENGDSETSVYLKEMSPVDFVENIRDAVSTARQYLPEGGFSGIRTTPLPEASGTSETEGAKATRTLSPEDKISEDVDSFLNPRDLINAHPELEDDRREYDQRGVQPTLRENVERLKQLAKETSPSSETDFKSSLMGVLDSYLEHCYNLPQKKDLKEEREVVETLVSLARECVRDYYRGTRIDRSGLLSRLDKVSARIAESAGDIHAQEPNAIVAGLSKVLEINNSFTLHQYLYHVKKFGIGSPDTVVGIPSGGIEFSLLVAEALGVENVTFTRFSEDKGDTKSVRLPWDQGVFKGRDVMICDDFINQGHSFNNVARDIQKDSPASIGFLPAVVLYPRKIDKSFERVEGAGLTYWKWEREREESREASRGKLNSKVAVEVEGARGESDEVDLSQETKVARTPQPSDSGVESAAVGKSQEEIETQEALREMGLPLQFRFSPDEAEKLEKMGVDIEHLEDDIQETSELKANLGESPYTLAAVGRAAQTTGTGVDQEEMYDFLLDVFKRAEAERLQRLEDMSGDRGANASQPSSLEQKTPLSPEVARQVENAHEKIDQIGDLPPEVRSFYKDAYTIMARAKQTGDYATGVKEMRGRVEEMGIEVDIRDPSDHEGDIAGNIARLNARGGNKGQGLITVKSGMILGPLRDEGVMGELFHEAGLLTIRQAESPEQMKERIFASQEAQKIVGEQLRTHGEVYTFLYNEFPVVHQQISEIMKTKSVPTQQAFMAERERGIERIREESPAELWDRWFRYRMELPKPSGAEQRTFSDQEAPEGVSPRTWEELKDIPFSEGENAGVEYVKALRERFPGRVSIYATSEGNPPVVRIGKAKGEIEGSTMIELPDDGPPKVMSFDGYVDSLGEREEGWIGIQSAEILSELSDLEYREALEGSPVKVRNKPLFEGRRMVSPATIRKDATREKVDIDKTRTMSPERLKVAQEEVREVQKKAVTPGYITKLWRDARQNPDPLTPLNTVPQIHRELEEAGLDPKSVQNTLDEIAQYMTQPDRAEAFRRIQEIDKQSQDLSDEELRKRAEEVDKIQKLLSIIDTAEVVREETSLIQEEKDVLFRKLDSQLEELNLPPDRTERIKREMRSGEWEKPFRGGKSGGGMTGGKGKERKLGSGEGELGLESNPPTPAEQEGPLGSPRPLRKEKATGLKAALRKGVEALEKAIGRGGPPPDQGDGPPAPPKPPEGERLERMTPEERGLEIRRRSQEIANQALGMQEKAKNLPSTDRTLGRTGMAKTDWTSVGGEMMVVGSQMSWPPDSPPFSKNVSVYFTKPGAVKDVDESKPITEKDALAYMARGHAVFLADKDGNLWYHTEDKDGSPTHFKYPVEASYGVREAFTSVSAQMGTEAGNRLEVYARHVQEGEPETTSLPGDHLDSMLITLTKETQLTEEEIREMDRKAYYEGGETEGESEERLRKRGGVFGHKANVVITRQELDEQGRGGLRKQLRFKDGTSADLLVRTTEEGMLEMTLEERDPATGEPIETSCGSMPLDPEGLTDELLHSMMAGVRDVGRQVEEHAMPGVAERKKVESRKLGEPQVVEEKRGIDVQIDQALAEAREVYERYQAMSSDDREFAGRDLLRMFDLVETTQDGRHFVKPIGDTGLSVVIPGERILGGVETRLEPPQILLGYAEADRKEVIRQEISQASNSPRGESGEVILEGLKTATEGGDVPILLDPENVEKVFVDEKGVHVVPDDRGLFTGDEGSKDIIVDILHETREAGDIHSQISQAMTDAGKIYREYEEVSRGDRASFVKARLGNYELVEMEENECLYARPIAGTDLSVAFPGNRWEIGEGEKEPDLRSPQILLGYAPKDQVESVQKAIREAAGRPREESGEVVLRDLKTTTEGGDVPILLDPDNVGKAFVDEEGVHIVPEFRGVEPGKDLYIDVLDETLSPEQQAGGEPKEPKPPKPKKPGPKPGGGPPPDQGDRPPRVPPKSSGGERLESEADDTRQSWEEIGEFTKPADTSVYTKHREPAGPDEGQYLNLYLAEVKRAREEKRPDAGEGSGREKLKALIYETHPNSKEKLGALFQKADEMIQQADEKGEPIEMVRESWETMRLNPDYRDVLEAKRVDYQKRLDRGKYEVGSADWADVTARVKMIDDLLEKGEVDTVAIMDEVRGLATEENSAKLDKELVNARNVVGAYNDGTLGEFEAFLQREEGGGIPPIISECPSENRGRLRRVLLELYPNQHEKVDKAFEKTGEVPDIPDEYKLDIRGGLNPLQAWRSGVGPPPPWMPPPPVPPKKADQEVKLPPMADAKPSEPQTEESRERIGSEQTALEVEIEKDNEAFAELQVLKAGMDLKEFRENQSEQKKLESETLESMRETVDLLRESGLCEEIVGVYEKMGIYNEVNPRGYGDVKHKGGVGMSIYPVGSNFRGKRDGSVVDVSDSPDGGRLLFFNGETFLNDEVAERIDTLLEEGGHMLYENDQSLTVEENMVRDEATALLKRTEVLQKLEESGVIKRTQLQIKLSQVLGMGRLSKEESHNKAMEMARMYTDKILSQHDRPSESQGKPVVSPVETYGGLPVRPYVRKGKAAETPPPSLETQAPPVSTITQEEAKEQLEDHGVTPPEPGEEATLEQATQTKTQPEAQAEIETAQDEGTTGELEAVDWTTKVREAKQELEAKEEERQKVAKQAEEAARLAEEARMQQLREEWEERKQRYEGVMSDDLHSSRGIEREVRRAAELGPEAVKNLRGEAAHYAPVIIEQMQAEETVRRAERLGQVDQVVLDRVRNSDRLTEELKNGFLEDIQTGALKPFMVDILRRRIEEELERQDLESRRGSLTFGERVDLAVLNARQNGRDALDGALSTLVGDESLGRFFLKHPVAASMVAGTKGVGKLMSAVGKVGGAAWSTGSSIVHDVAGVTQALARSKPIMSAAGAIRRSVAPRQYVKNLGGGVKEITTVPLRARLTEGGWRAAQAAAALGIENLPNTAAALGGALSGLRGSTTSEKQQRLTGQAPPKVRKGTGVSSRFQRVQRGEEAPSTTTIKERTGVVSGKQERGVGKRSPEAVTREIEKLQQQLVSQEKKVNATKRRLLNRKTKEVQHELRELQRDVNRARKELERLQQERERALTDSFKKAATTTVTPTTQSKIGPKSLIPAKDTVVDLSEISPQARDTLAKLEIEPASGINRQQLSRLKEAAETLPAKVRQDLGKAIYAQNPTSTTIEALIQNGITIPLEIIERQREQDIAELQRLFDSSRTITSPVVSKVVELKHPAGTKVQKGVDTEVKKTQVSEGQTQKVAGDVLTKEEAEYEGIEVVPTAMVVEGLEAFIMASSRESGSKRIGGEGESQAGSESGGEESKAIETTGNLVIADKVHKIMTRPTDKQALALGELLSNAQARGDGSVVKIEDDDDRQSYVIGVQGVGTEVASRQIIITTKLGGHDIQPDDETYDVVVPPSERTVTATGKEGSEVVDTSPIVVTIQTEKIVSGPGPIIEHRAGKVDTGSLENAPSEDLMGTSHRIPDELRTSGGGKDFAKPSRPDSVII